MGGVFSKKGVTSKVVPGDAPRTQSAPAGLGRCSPVLGVDATHGIITTRPASAEEPSGCLSDRPGSSDTAVFSDRRLRSVGGGRPIVDAAAVAALRPFEKHGNDGKTPSGVVPEGSDPVRALPALPFQRRHPILFFFGIFRFGNERSECPPMGCGGDLAPGASRDDRRVSRGYVGKRIVEESRAPIHPRRRWVVTRTLSARM